MIVLPKEPHFPIWPYVPGRSSLNSDAHLLAENLSTFVFPEGYTRRGGLIIEIEGETEDVETAKIILKSVDHYDYHRGASEIVSHAGNVLAREICSEDAISMFELCQADDGPALVPINPVHVRTFFNVLCSPTLLRSRNWARSLASGRRFFVMRFPASLGGSWKFRRMLRDLKNIGPIVPRFAADLNTQRLDASMQGYRHDYIAFLTSATKSLGWYAGGSYFRYCTEYYLLHRAIVSKRARILLREHIVSEINRFFAQISLACRIVVTGGATVADCDAYQEKLRRGEIVTSELSAWIHDEE